MLFLNIPGSDAISAGFKAGAKCQRYKCAAIATAASIRLVGRRQPRLDAGAKAPRSTARGARRAERRLEDAAVRGLLPELEAGLPVESLHQLGHDAALCAQRHAQLAGDRLIGHSLGQQLEHC